MKVLGIIPARSGSKGVPGKNCRELAGMSLIERAYRAAQASGVLDRIILSTDDLQAMQIARQIGLEVPFVRPAHLSGDSVGMLDVVTHALHQMDPLGYTPTAVMLLQPTSPLRRPEHLRRAVELLQGAESVCSVVPLPLTHCPHYVMRFDDHGFLAHFLPEGSRVTRRQDVPQAYVREGSVYLTKRSVLIEKRSFYGDRCVPLVLDPAESLSIDTMEDWAEAERRLERAAA